MNVFDLQQYNVSEKCQPYVQGTDTDGAVSEWAQTLLQLVQTPPIDMGVLLPYSALDDLTKLSGSVLGATLIGKATFTAAGGGTSEGAADGADGDEVSTGGGAGAAEGAGEGARRTGETETHDEFEFAATLLAGKEFEQNSFDVIGGPREAWRALALALRYAPYGARIFATQEALRGADARHFRGGGRREDAS